MENPLAGRVFKSKPSLHAVTGPSACYRPRLGVEAQHRKSSPSERRRTWGLSYPKCIYTGVGEFCHLRNETRAEAEGAEMNNFDEQSEP